MIIFKLANFILNILFHKLKFLKINYETISEDNFSNVLGMPYESYEPLWFKKQEDPFTDSLCHMYNGEYWECKNKQDWSRCPNIF